MDQSYSVRYVTKKNQQPSLLVLPLLGRLIATPKAGRVHATDGTAYEASLVLPVGI